MIKKIRRISHVFKWQKAISLASKGEFANALEQTRGLELPNGAQQEAAILRANCAYHLNDLEKSKKNYAIAIASEKRWGKRVPASDSDYLLKYSRLFLLMIEARMGFDREEEIISAYDDLLNVRASTRLKEELFPPPVRSSIDGWLREKSLTKPS